MNDYSQIVGKIRSSPWLIMPESLQTILSIVDRRMDGERLTDDEIKMRIAGGRSRNDIATREIGAGVGVLPLQGPIFPKANMMTEMSGATSLEQFRDDFRTLMANDQVSAIVLDVDSPGGMSDLVMETGNEIRAARDIKPIYSVANTMTGSAALWIASQATEFYATPSGLVGSLGAYTVHEDHSGELEQKGISTTIISAGRFKVEGSPTGPLSTEAEAYRQKMINELYDEFVNAVAQGRNRSKADVIANFGEGRMLTPKDALSVGMIDGIATMDDVLGELLTQVQAPQAINRAHAHILVPTSKAYLESAEWEHSDPGTGPTPVPVPPEPDKAKTGGWRRDTPPIAKEEQEASVVDRTQLTQLAGRLGVSVNAAWTDDELFAAVDTAQSALLEEVTPLREAAASVETNRSFAEQFPEEAARLAKSESRERLLDAREFSAKYERFKDTDGKSLTTGFSARSLTHIETMHTAIAESKITHEHLEKFLDSVAEAGIVDYGTKGSSRISDDDVDPVIEGNVNARQQFANRVKHYMEEDGLDRAAAIKMAAEKHPAEFEAYQRPIVNRS